MKIDKNGLVLGVAVIGIIVAGFLIFTGPDSNFSFPDFTLGFGTSSKQIAENAVKYINEAGLAGAEVSLVSFSDESGLVKIRIKIGDKEFDSYVTKDGKFLFPNSPIDMAAEEEEIVAQTCDSLEKTEKPQLEIYIVSKCPYGLQLQRVAADLVKNAPALEQNVFIRYIGSVSGNKVDSMHGEEEATENLRQICIRDEQRSKYWDYVSCHIKAGDVDTCLESAAIDQNKLSSCMSDSKKGLAYAKADFDLNEKYGVEGSPTLILNGAKISEADFGGRSTEALKTIICCASTSEPDACSTKLNTASAAASFSATYGGSGSDSTANCN